MDGWGTGTVGALDGVRQVRLGAGGKDLTRNKVDEGATTCKAKIKEYTFRAIYRRESGPRM